MTPQPDVPPRLARRLRDLRGMIVPYAQFIDANGNADFRVLDDRRVSYCLEHRRCAMCGEPLGRHLHFVGGPLCAVNGLFYDPPTHKECAEYALQACPHLARLKGRFARIPDSIPGAAHIVIGALASDEKQDIFALMHTTDFTFGRDHAGMMLIKAKLPWLDVAWWREGKRIEQ